MSNGRVAVDCVLCVRPVPAWPPRGSGSQKQLSRPGESKGGGESCSTEEAANMASKVLDLVYWKELEKTGIVFTGLVISLLCMFQFTAISVVSNLCLAVMCFTFPMRLLYTALELLSRKKVGHPFKWYLERDLSLTDEQTVYYVERIVLLTASAVMNIKHFLFIGSISDSVKFLVLMYLLTCIGAQCNGLTLLIAGVISAFSLPLFYSRQEERINKLVTSVQRRLRTIKEITQRAKLTTTSAPTSGPKTKPKTK
ncbi:reticulon-1-A-like [Arapaima gigas]